MKANTPNKPNENIWIKNPINKIDLAVAKTSGLSELKRLPPPAWIRKDNTSQVTKIAVILLALIIEYDSPTKVINLPNVTSKRKLG